jgi:DMSO/TMAO reductase YedYZ molybdopterin-dependent catalytic subunit
LKLNLVEIGDAMINPEYITHLELTKYNGTIVATKIHFVGGGSIVVDVSLARLAELLCQKSTADVPIAA